MGTKQMLLTSYWWAGVVLVMEDCTFVQIHLSSIIRPWPKIKNTDGSREDKAPITWHHNLSDWKLALNDTTYITHEHRQGQCNTWEVKLRHAGRQCVVQLHKPMYETRKSQAQILPSPVNSLDRIQLFHQKMNNNDLISSVWELWELKLNMIYVIR